jgi:hypothetical protein
MHVQQNLKFKVERNAEQSCVPLTNINKPTDADFILSLSNKENW